MTKGNADAGDTRALYRKYRSKSLAEVVGQEHITDILSRALAQGKIAHAYLFTGPRGVGKTSVARILAHEINGLPYEENTVHPDIIEIDAASNRRIDDIRDLRDKVQIAPTSAKYKVYIIDEVHMLTGESFNAFLKTLEEPPAHVVFILATTDAHKLPVTITSRAQRFGFRAIAPAAALTHLRSIANSEKIAIDDGALELIVAHGDGSFRDSISLLDQLSSLSTEDQAITRELVESMLGMASSEQIEALLRAYAAGDRRLIIQQLSLFEQQGIAATIVASQLMKAVRAQITESPHLLKLLDSLISVAASPRPDMRLLVTLLPPASVHKTVTAAVVTELRPLAEEAVKTLPREENIRSKTSASKMSTEVPSIKEMSTKSERKTTANTIPNNTESKPDSIHAEKPAAESSRQSSTGVSVEFDWGGYVTYMKEHHVALASILAKCKAESDGTTLTVYTGTAFWKKKLDDIKYQPILHDALKTLAMGDLTIETVPSTMPPKDSQAAAVAAIMGGGEEVAL